MICAVEDNTLLLRTAAELAVAMQPPLYHLHPLHYLECDKKTMGSDSPDDINVLVTHGS